MAFFGAPLEQPDHADRAVSAALKIQEEIGVWNRERTGRGEPPLEVRIAVNTGEAIVGDIGSERRVDYTVLGNAVNVAARLEEFVAQPGDVVIGPRHVRGDRRPLLLRAARLLRAQGPLGAGAALQGDRQQVGLRAPRHSGGATFSKRRASSAILPREVELLVGPVVEDREQRLGGVERGHRPGLQVGRQGLLDLVGERVVGMGVHEPVGHPRDLDRAARARLVGPPLPELDELARLRRRQARLGAGRVRGRGNPTAHRGRRGNGTAGSASGSTAVGEGRAGVGRTATRRARAGRASRFHSA